jgi:CRISPR-associated protein Cmr2
MKYTAITIGPIFKTLQRAKKTREIWAGSFLFSNIIMGRIIDKLKSKGFDKNIIIPYPEVNKQKLPHVGLFPDRLVMQGDHFDTLNGIIDEVKDELKNEFKKVRCSAQDIDSYIDNFFTLNIVTADANENNALDEMLEFLKTSELYQKPVSKDPMCIEKLLQNVTKTVFYDKVFGSGRSFPSIIEISASKIYKYFDINKLIDSLDKKRDDDDFDDDLIKKLVEINNFKQAHKYIAIVYSDGDRIGSIVKKIYETSKNPTSDLKQFSKILSEFASKATEIVNEYGGETIYAGGDDLLFFAPVLTHDSNIFKLINKIDDIFQQYIIENTDLKDVISGLNPQPSMSYGVSITYYKFPMHEAMDEAHNNIQKAKEAGRNRIGYTWQKHSGQAFHDILEKNNNPDTFYRLFIDMLNSDEKKSLTSIMYNLNEHKFILKEIINDDNKLDNYFTNFYDEDIHKKERAFIDHVKKLIISVRNENNGTSADDILKKVYNALRFYKFLTQKAEKNE